MNRMKQSRKQILYQNIMQKKKKNETFEGNFELKYYIKKNCFDESNETFEGNFELKCYTKKNCFDESNETFEGTNFVLKYYAKKKIVSTNRMKCSRE